MLLYKSSYNDIGRNPHVKADAYISTENARFGGGAQIFVTMIRGLLDCYIFLQVAKLIDFSRHLTPSNINKSAYCKKPQNSPITPL